MKGVMVICISIVMLRHGLLKEHLFVYRRRAGESEVIHVALRAGKLADEPYMKYTTKSTSPVVFEIHLSSIYKTFINSI